MEMGSGKRDERERKRERRCGEEMVADNVGGEIRLQIRLQEIEVVGR